MLIALLPLAFFCGRYVSPTPEVPGKVDTLYVRDTIRLAGETIIRTEYVFLPVAHQQDEAPQGGTSTRDSALVALPIVQREFEGEYYKAIVQGYQPELVNIQIKIPKHKEKKGLRLGWGFGFQVGFGITPAGWQPYLGFGATAGMVD